MLVSAVLCAVAVSSVVSAPFVHARIGDVDGFGWGDPDVPGSFHFQALEDPQGPWRSSSTTIFYDDDEYNCGVRVDTDFRQFNFDNDGFLGMGDFLPDLDKRCSQVGGDTIPRRHVKHAMDLIPDPGIDPTDPFGIWTTDDWDWREDDEKGDQKTEANGCTFLSAFGSKFTDMTLSSSYKRSFPGSSFVFPTNPRTGESNPEDNKNQPRFIFDIKFDTTNITRVQVPNGPVPTKFFFNVAFGDHDVGKSTQLRFIANPGAGQITAFRCLNKQSLFFEDGFIQGSTVELNEVFGANWPSVLRSVDSGTKFAITLQVDWIDAGGAENQEPYTAFDFAEIALDTSSVKILRVPTTQFPTIQSAINSVNPGDYGWTILVSPGTYNERLVFGGRSPSLLGRSDCFDGIGSPSTAPVINAQGLGAAITMTGSEKFLQIAGFKIINGSASTGAAIRANGARAEINHCTFEANVASGNGGAITSLNGPILNCEFTDNQGAHGGAVYNSSGPILNGTFTSNTASGNGGGVALISGKVELCLFADNTALGNGGGASQISGPVLTCIFDENSANYGGGAHNLFGSVFDCDFTDNLSTWGGGGIANMSNSTALIQDCTFVSNDARDGAGMLNYDSSPHIDRCDFRLNIATNSGGGIQNIGDQFSAESYPLITNCVFWLNLATNATNGVAGGYGGGIMNYLYAAPTVTNCSFALNYAKVNGGGIANYEEGAWTVLRNCVLNGNTSVGITQSNFFTHPWWPVGSPLPTHSMITSYTGSGTSLKTLLTQLPVFENVGAGDLHIKSESDCKNAGTNTGAPALDRDSFARPLTLFNRCDMGAYEFH